MKTLVTVLVSSGGETRAHTIDHKTNLYQAAKEFGWFEGANLIKFTAHGARPNFDGFNDGVPFNMPEQRS